MPRDLTPARTRTRSLGALLLPLIGVSMIVTLDRAEPVAAIVTAPGGVSSGLVLWLDASNPNGDGTSPAPGAAVSTWADLSGAGNTASVNPNGIGDPNTAAYFETAPAGFNGQPALRFDRIDDNSGSVYQTANLDLRANARPDVTIMTVYQPSATSANNGVWGIDDGNWDRFFLSYHSGFGDRLNDGLVGLGPVQTGQTVADSGTVNVPQLMTVGYSGDVVNGENVGDPDASFVYYNCALERTFTDSTHPTDARSTLSVGWDGDNSVFAGHIAEVIVYERVLSLTELEAVSGYLATKYGFTSGCGGAACDVSEARTFSQGGWSNTATTSSLTDAWFDEAFDPDLTIGGDLRSVTLDSAANVRRFLPQSGTPAVLNSTFTNPTSRQLKNTLAGQATALTLNLALNPGMAPAELVSGYEGTVADLLDDVNAALNGTGSPSKSYLSQLSRYAEIVNLSFLGGIDWGYVTCPPDEGD